MEFINNIKWYLRKKWKSYTVGVALILLTDVLSVIPSYIIRLVVDDMEQGLLTPDALTGAVLFLLAVNLVTYGAKIVYRLLVFGNAADLTRRLRNMLYDHYTRMSPSFFSRYRIGDLMARSTNDLKGIENACGMGMVTLFDSLVLGAMILVSMVVFTDWRLAFISLIPLPFMAFAKRSFGKVLRKRYRESNSAFGDLNTFIRENIAGIKLVKIFGLREKHRLEFARKTDAAAERDYSAVRYGSLYAPVSMTLSGFSQFLGLGFGGYFVYRGILTLGQLIQFNVYLAQLSWPMAAYGITFNMLDRGTASYDRILDILDTEEEIRDEGTLETCIHGRITVDIGGAGYDGETVLRDISFEIEPGSMVAVTGPTGGGKSTLLKTLIRQLECKTGNVFFNGRPVSDYRLSALRRAVGYVPQEPVLFSLSVRDNIAFGKPSASEKEIGEAARLACVDEDIRSFALGYDTMIGERGTKISGGQKQRVSIARALLPDPDILIMDDPVSAVDADTERKIMGNLLAYRGRKTIVTAIHRMSVASVADLIIVIDKGRAVEIGTHEELMAADGWYAAVYRRQNIEERGEGHAS